MYFFTIANHGIIFSLKFFNALLEKLTLYTPHLGSLTRIRSYSNCKSSPNLASKSMQNPEQHLMSSVRVKLGLEMGLKKHKKWIKTRVKIK